MLGKRNSWRLVNWHGTIALSFSLHNTLPSTYFSMPYILKRLIENLYVYRQSHNNDFPLRKKNIKNYYMINGYILIARGDKYIRTCINDNSQ